MILKVVFLIKLLEVVMTEQKLIKARAKLMKGNVGMASMLLNLDLVEDSSFDTLATDGQKIYWNKDFVKSISEKELQAVLVHEASHVIWEHPLRKGNRDHVVWNYATDYVINGYLFFDLGMKLPKGGLIDYQYKGWSAEKVYKHLLDDQEALQDAVDQVTESFDLDDIDSGSTDTNDLPLPVGEIIAPTDEEGNQLGESELAELGTEIRNAVSKADKLEKAIGSESGSAIGRRMDELKEINFNWHELLNDFLLSTVADDSTWARPNKRHSWRGIYLPSKVKSSQGGELAIAIDTSCSIDQDELNIFTTEIISMAESCGLEKIRVCYCDTVVRKNLNDEWWDVYELDQGDEIKLEARGGGGTKFEPPFNLFNDYSEDVQDVKAFVYFTDGYGMVDADVEPDVPVIWCVTDVSQYSENLPFGEVVYVDRNSLVA